MWTSQATLVRLSGFAYGYHLEDDDVSQFLADNSVPGTAFVGSEQVLMQGGVLDHLDALRRVSTSPSTPTTRNEDFPSIGYAAASASLDPPEATSKVLRFSRRVTFGDLQNDTYVDGDLTVSLNPSDVTVDGQNVYGTGNVAPSVREENELLKYKLQIVEEDVGKLRRDMNEGQE
ncbi:hypothetical protein IAU59_007636 [Kwoniella sp. CBS 9459]